MTLFAVLGIPCFTVFIAAVVVPQAASQRRAGYLPRGTLALLFLKGFLFAVPSLIIILLLRRFVPFSYRFFPLYLYYLLVEQLVPLAALAAAYFLAYSQRSFRELLLFGGGFFTLLGLAEVLYHYGQHDPYFLFILPAVRMAILLFLPIFYLRFQEWYGVVRALFLALLVMLPVLGAAISYLYMRFYYVWAVLIAAFLFFGSLVYLALEREY